MKSALLAFFLVCATGCGGHLQIEGFEDYVHGFERDAKKYGYELEIQNLVITWSERLQGSTVGLCTRGPVPFIEIKKSYWDLIKSGERKILIYHELGHCILMRDHTASSFVNKDKFVLPGSIMHPYILSGFYFEQNEDYYLKELFEGGIYE
jgi:hypothetical protein